VNVELKTMCLFEGRVYYSRICMKGVRKTRKLHQNIQSQCRHFNPGTQEYEAGILASQYIEALGWMSAE
jgi:hypothetical protein